MPEQFSRKFIASILLLSALLFSLPNQLLLPTVQYHGVVKSFNRRVFPPLDNTNDSLSDASSTTNPNPPQLVNALKEIGHTIQLAAIIPSTGHIRVHEVLNAIDSCVDETLRILRHKVMIDRTFRIVALGFSTFVMNLVAVDIYGNPVGEVATCSYACNREDVVDECERLRE